MLGGNQVGRHRSGKDDPSFPWLAEPEPLKWLKTLPYYPWLVVGTVCVGAFMGQLDASIAQLVLPTLEEVFRAAFSTVEWVALAYLLTLAALLAPVGRLADMMGRKLLYTVGFLVFVAGSALCGGAPSLPLLIGARILQATGAALLQANSVAIVTAAAGPKRRGRAIGIQGAAQAIGLSVGPALGGLLISAVGWRWVFFINIPVGIIGAALGWLILPTTPGLRGRQRFDLPGTVTLAGAFVAMLVALSKGQTWGWLSPWMVLLSVAAVVLAGIFVYRERHTPAPVVDLALFRIRSFTMGNITGLLAYAVTFGVFLLVPFDLERVRGASPLLAGGLLTAVPVALGIVAPLSGAWSDRVGPRLPTTTGMFIAAAALVLLAFVANGPSFALMIPGLLALGGGLGLFTPANNSAIMGSAPLGRLGVAGGVLNMMRSLGTSLGVAIAGTVLAVTLQILFGQGETTLTASPVQVAAAMRVALLAMAALALLAAILSAPRGGTQTTTDRPVLEC